MKIYNSIAAVGTMWKPLSIVLLFVLAAHGRANTFKQRVCVIGAGPGGLISIKNVADYPNEFDIIAFEKQSDVGGQWIYTNSTTVDKHGLPVHSSIYKHLRLNALKEYLRFPNFTEIMGENTSWMGYAILEYLRNYTDHFNLPQYIKNLNTKQIKKIECDAIMIANGQTSKGHIPNIPGIESFRGQVLHSHVYREPEVFAGQKVVILRAGFSGLDTSFEICNVAELVYLSHRHDKLQVELPSSGLVVDSGKYVRYVYKHTINVERPTMAILNILQPSINLLLPHAQVQYYVAVLRGKVNLPTREEMLKEAELPEGTPKNKAHLLLEEVFYFYNEYVVAGGGTLVPLVYKADGAIITYYVTTDPLHFREKNLYLFGNGSFQFT